MSSVLSASTSGAPSDESVVAPTQPDLTPPVPTLQTPIAVKGIEVIEEEKPEGTPLKRSKTEEVVLIEDCLPPDTQKDPEKKRPRTETAMEIIAEYEALLAAHRRFLNRINDDKQADEVTRKQYQEMRVEYLKELGQLLTILADKWKCQVFAY